MKSFFKILLILSSVSFLPSCSSHATRPKGSGEIAVSGVDVTIDPQSLTGERKTVFESLDGANQIKGFTRLKLERAGLVNPSSPNRLKITVTGFKLRSGATAALAGLFAGQDSVTARVTVGTPKNEIQSFTIDEGSFGSMGSISRNSRGEDLFRAVAEVIVDRID